MLTSRCFYSLTPGVSGQVALAAPVALIALVIYHLTIHTRDPPHSSPLESSARFYTETVPPRLASSRRFDAPRQTPGSRQPPNRDYRAPFKPRDYSRTKCFSCGQLGHTQVRCPKPDSSLPFRPSGWVDRSDGPRRNSGASPQGNEI